MKRRDLLKQAVAFAALASVRASQAGAAETHQLAESLLGEKPAPPWLELGPAPAETRKDNMLFRKLGRTGERISAFGLGGHHIGLVKEEQDSIKLIRSAIDRGITFMDKRLGVRGCRQAPLS